MELEGLLGIIKEFGLPLVLLLGAIYALYRFMVFSLYEVKNQFSKHHERAAENIDDMKASLAEIKADLKLIIEFIKTIKK